ncbi:MAG: S-layer homology domain-containing protein, partial [Clostridia bacterium]|nr:S-layer homology domain-containing protein [Clostridia bacterium]
MKKITRIISALLVPVMILAASVITVSAKDLYNDVKSTRWSAANIAYVTEKGYMTGVGGGNFAPAKSVTRGMVVTVLYRLNGSHKVRTKSTFKDVPRDSWFTEAVDWASFHGVVNGTSETTFSPNADISREALATMIYRYAVTTGVKEYEPGNSDAAKRFNDWGKVSSWAKTAMEWAISVGLINGMTETTVEPKKTSTREQFAAILQRYTESKFDYIFEDLMNEMADEAEAQANDLLERKAASPDGVSLDNWGEGMLILGLFEAGRLDAVKKYVDAYIDFGDVPMPTDSGILGYIVCCMYEIYGEEKYADLAGQFLAGYDDWPTDKLGQIKYDSDRSPEAQDVYVDGTGFATLFLAKYAAVFNDAKVRDTAILQVENYLKYGIWQQFGLVAHGYSNASKLEGEFGWGRGTGWLMLAIASVLSFDNPDSALVEKCADLVNKTMSFVLDTDNFSWSLNVKSGPSDTSATGTIMWGVLKSKEDEDRFPDVSLERIKSVAMSCLPDIKDGVVYGSSGGAGGWYVYSPAYGN